MAWSAAGFSCRSLLAGCPRGRLAAAVWRPNAFDRGPQARIGVAAGRGLIGKSAGIPARHIVLVSCSVAKLSVIARRSWPLSMPRAKRNARRRPGYNPAVIVLHRRGRGHGCRSLSAAAGCRLVGHRRGVPGRLVPAVLQAAEHGRVGRAAPGRTGIGRFLAPLPLEPVRRRRPGPLRPHAATAGLH